MKTAKSRKCVPSKNKWCEAIKLIADFGNPDAIGLAVSNVVNVSTHKKGAGLRYGVPRNKRKELGCKYIWPNFCPFCGHNISKRTEK